MQKITTYLIAFAISIFSLLSCKKDASQRILAFGNVSNASVPLGDTANNPYIINWTDSIWQSWDNPLINPFNFKLPIKFGPPPCPTCGVDSSVVLGYEQATYTVVTPPNGIIINAVTPSFGPDGMEIHFSLNAKYFSKEGTSFSITSNDNEWQFTSLGQYQEGAGDVGVGGTYYGTVFSYTFKANQYFSEWGHAEWWPVLITVTCGYPGPFPYGIYSMSAACEVRVTYPWESQL